MRPIVLGSVAVSLVGPLAFLALSATVLAAQGPFRFVGADFIAYYVVGRLVLLGALLWQGRPGLESSTSAGSDHAGEVEQAAVA